MKNFSAALVAYLNTHELPDIADLFIIQLANGQVINATSGQLDIINAGATPPTTFYATKYGKWNRGAIISEASFDLTPNPMPLTFIDNDPDAGGPILFPVGNASILQSITAGLFDGARVIVYTAYMPTYGDLSLGLETKFVGDITAVKAVDRAHVEFTVTDLLYRLSQQWPPNLFQAPCRHTVFNVNCTLDPATFRTNRTVAGGGTNTFINLTAGLAAVGNDALPYTQGVLTFVTGNNAGLSSTIRAQITTTRLQLDLPAFMTVQAGDIVALLPGCNKLKSTCLLKYNNVINYGGQLYTPVPETVL